MPYYVRGDCLKTIVMSSTGYTSVEELIRDIAPDGGFCGELHEELDESKTCRRLVALRTVRGLSQSDVAKRMGCPQCRIAELENSSDARWTVDALHAYAGAIGCKVTVALDAENPCSPPPSSGARRRAVWHKSDGIVMTVLGAVILCLVSLAIVNVLIATRLP